VRRENAGAMSSGGRRACGACVDKTARFAAQTRKNEREENPRIERETDVTPFSHAGHAAGGGGYGRV